MSPKRRGDWKPPRDRREVVLAVLASVAVVIVTATLVWFLRPNRGSGSSAPESTVATSTTAAGATTTSAPTTTVPAATSTP
jgi:hypothetical protein